MPEYSQIQTYIRCGEQNFKYNLLQYQLLLKDIGFCEEYIKENFQGIKWIEEENGFIYSGCDFKAAKFHYNNFSLELRPLVAGWTPHDFTEQVVQDKYIYIRNDI
jgi:hypothetical protein